MRVVAAIGLTCLAVLDAGAAVVGATVAEVLVHDPVRPWGVEAVRGLIALVAVAGGPALAALLAAGAALGVAAGQRAAGFVGLGIGAVHVGVPVVGLAVVLSCGQWVRAEDDDAT